MNKFDAARKFADETRRIKRYEQEHGALFVLQAMYSGTRVWNVSDVKIEDDRLQPLNVDVIRKMIIAGYLIERSDRMIVLAPRAYTALGIRYPQKMTYRRWLYTYQHQMRKD